MMRHRHTITSRDHVPRVSPFIKSKSRMTNVERPERGVELRPTRRNFPMLAMDGTSESFDFSFLSSEDVLSYREFRSRFNCRFSFHDIFPRSKWKVARNTRREEENLLECVSVGLSSGCQVTSHRRRFASFEAKARGDDCSG